MAEVTKCNASVVTAIITFGFDNPSLHAPDVGIVIDSMDDSPPKTATNYYPHVIVFLMNAKITCTHVHDYYKFTTLPPFNTGGIKLNN